MLLLHVGFEAKLAQQELIFKLIIKCGIDIESILAFIILYYIRDRSRLSQKCKAKLYL